MLTWLRYTRTGFTVMITNSEKMINVMRIGKLTSHCPHLGDCTLKHNEQRTQGKLYQKSPLHHWLLPTVCFVSKDQVSSSFKFYNTWSHSNYRQGLQQYLLRVNNEYLRSLARKIVLSDHVWLSCMHFWIAFTFHCKLRRHWQ